LKTASTERGLSVPVRLVTATRGKSIRAEPIAHLFTQGKVKLVGRFQQLEDQLASFTSWGYAGDRSPDRADAAIWGVTALTPRLMGESRRSRSEPVRVVTSVNRLRHQVRIGSGVGRIDSSDPNHGYVPRDQRAWPARSPNVIRTRPK